MAIRDVNAREDLLPNVTLGFVYLDVCGGARGAMARSVYFLPDHRTCALPDLDTANGSSCSPFDLDLLAVKNAQPHFDVVGVIGPGWSSQAVPVGSLYHVFEIPIISQSATSDELSDKTRYKYFSRVCPSDRLLADAIVDILYYYEWNYIIVLYSEGSYGENLAKQMEKRLKGSSVCFALSYRIPSDVTEADLEDLTDKVASESRARVVVSFMEGVHRNAVIEKLRGKVAKNQFLYIGGDWFQYMYTTEYADMVEGSIFFNIRAAGVPGFQEYFERKRKWDEPISPWVKRFWENNFGCSWTATTTSNNSCYLYDDVTQVDDYFLVPDDYHYSRYVDAVEVYADSLHRLLTSECPEVRPEHARKCVTGNNLLRYIRSADFPGLNGRVRFDASGDVLSKYGVHQIRRNNTTGEYTTIIIGEWDVFAPDGERLIIDKNLIDFSMFRYKYELSEGDFDGDGLDNNDDLDGDDLDNNDDLDDGDDLEEGNLDEVWSLRSVCSEPCPPRHTVVREDTPCCWECNPCRQNEILVKNGTSCVTCPLTSWPDPDTASRCDVIPPTFLHWRSVIASVLLTTSSLALITGVVVVALFHRNRGHKLVRATSRGLSNLILVGVTLACADVYLITCPPSRDICLTRRAAFHLSVTLMYAPLLIKTVRIYRVFVNSMRGLQKVRFVSGNQMIALAFLLTAAQVIILVVTEIEYPSSPAVIMPVVSEMYTELVCQQELIGFLLPLSYNVLLILVCAVLGYLSRKLPQNFNESWYIFIMVATTLFMWVVFLPTYFTTFYAYYKVVFLALCLILNAVITLGTLFVPRIYAIYYVSTDQMNYNTMTMTTNSAAVGIETSEAENQRTNST